MFDSFKEYDFQTFINCEIAEGNTRSVAWISSSGEAYVYTINFSQQLGVLADKIELS